MYPTSLFMDKTELDLASTLAFTNLLLPTRSVHEHWGSQIHQDMALLSHTTQGHLDLASKSPSSAEAFPRFPTSPTEQINKFSTLPSFLILLPRCSQRQSPSLLYPPQAHNSVIAVRGLQSVWGFYKYFLFHRGRRYLWCLWQPWGKGTKNLWYPSHPAASRTISVSGNAQRFRGRRSEGISVQQPTFA